MTTTVSMRNNPPLYLHPITKNYTQMEKATGIAEIHTLLPLLDPRITLQRIITRTSLKLGSQKLREKIVQGGWIF